MADTNQEISRGDAARRIIEEPLLREAFDSIRQRINDEWENSPVKQTDAREKLWMMLKCLNAVEGHLKTVMETGKLASLDLEQRRTMAEKARNVWDGLHW